MVQLPPVCCAQEHVDEEISEEHEELLAHGFTSSMEVLLESGVWVTEDPMP